MIKVLNVLIRECIKMLNYINTSYYMKCYIKWLKKRGVQIDDYDGRGFISPSAKLDGTDYKLIRIGKHVTISENVYILTHDYSIWHSLISIDESTYADQQVKFLKIIIGDNSFIGAGSIILPGTMIGKNCIIGAGSVVPGKKLMDNSIYAGNPIRYICSIDEFVYKHKNDWINVCKNKRRK